MTTELNALKITVVSNATQDMTSKTISSKFIETKLKLQNR
jgi:hypothetical protein